MKFYTVDDLKNVLDTYPCSDKKGYISYQKKRLIEMINRDFNGERLFLKRNVWNDEAPAVYGLNGTTLYSEEVKVFAKSQKTHGGGRNLIIMNEAYFFNIYYWIENYYWDSQRDTFKRDKKKSIRNAVFHSVTTENETELRHAVAQLLNAFLSKVNKEIASMNDFLKCKYSQFVFYLTFYRAAYVQKLIGNPTGLLLMLDNQMETMEDGFQALSTDDKKQKKFIDNIISLMLEKNDYVTNEEKVDIIVDRIYSRENPLIQELREKYEEFEKIKVEIYKLEEEIKTETEKRIRAGKGIFPGSLIIQYAKDNGLISISFSLSDK